MKFLNLSFNDLHLRGLPPSDIIFCPVSWVYLAHKTLEGIFQPFLYLFSTSVRNTWAGCSISKLHWKDMGGKGSYNPSIYLSPYVERIIFACDFFFFQIVVSVYVQWHFRSSREASKWRWRCTLRGAIAQALVKIHILGSTHNLSCSLATTLC